MELYYHHAASAQLQREEQLQHYTRHLVQYNLRLQQAAVQQELLGLEPLADAAATGGMPPSTGYGSSALGCLEGEADMKLECPMVEPPVRQPVLCCLLRLRSAGLLFLALLAQARLLSCIGSSAPAASSPSRAPCCNPTSPSFLLSLPSSQSLTFSASDAAYLFQPSMLPTSPPSGAPTSCTAVEHVNGTMLFTDPDLPAGTPPKAAAAATAAQEAAAAAQAAALASGLAEMQREAEEAEEAAAEELLLRAPPPSPSLRLSRSQSQAAAVSAALPAAYWGRALPPPSAQPASQSAFIPWPPHNTAASQAGLVQPGQLLSESPFASTTAPHGAAMPCASSPGRLVPVLPATAVPSPPDVEVPASHLSLPGHCPQPPFSIDAALAASAAALQQAGLLPPLHGGMGFSGRHQSGPDSTSFSLFAAGSEMPISG
jgi:hypothetical protein